MFNLGYKLKIPEETMIFDKTENKDIVKKLKEKIYG